jgi:RimJ/RimL family protein N-acetyltransferase
MYREVCERDLDGFYALIRDEHIKRYLLDGQDMSRDWTAAEILASQRLFETDGIGLWLVFEPARDPPIGFCGFRVFAELGPEPQILYAFRQRATGKGYATEVAGALVECARLHANRDSVLAGVDEPNLASIRVLEKVGFRPIGETRGEFGRLLYFRLP